MSVSMSVLLVHLYFESVACCQGSQRPLEVWPAAPKDRIWEVDIWYLLLIERGEQPLVWHNTVLDPLLQPRKLLQFILVIWYDRRPTLIARFMGPIWGRQDPGGPHVGPMNFVIWVKMALTSKNIWNNLCAPCIAFHPYHQRFLKFTFAKKLMTKNMYFLLFHPSSVWSWSTLCNDILIW